MSSPSGSGVVPDKPALAHETACSTCNDTKTVVVYVGGNDVGFTYDRVCQDCPDDPPVPAVTDDEAAVEVLALALGNVPATAVRDSQPPELRLMMKDRNERLASSLVAALRSAGFLIVNHTKET